MSLDISLIADKLNEDAKRKERAQNQDQAPDMNQWISIFFLPLSFSLRLYYYCYCYHCYHCCYFDMINKLS